MPSFPSSYFLLSLITLLLYLPLTPALRFYLHDRERRCFKFDSSYSARVIGSASVANGPGSAELSLEVLDPSNKLVFSSQRGSSSDDAKFAFRTPDHYTGAAPEPDEDYRYEEYDLDSTYTACLVLAFDEARHAAGVKRAVEFWIRPEKSARFATEPRAKEGTMVSVNSALGDMQDILRGIVVDLAALQQRERRLVKRTEMTSDRLLLFAVLSLVVLMGTSVMQFMHFKTYFKSKKLV